MKILITDTHELAGLGAVRSLGRAKHEVVAGFPVGRSKPAALHSRFCSGYVTYPDPWTSNYQFREWLHRVSPDFDLVLPISEAALVAADQIGESKAIVPPSASLTYILSKRAATRKALDLGIPCPNTAFERSAAMELLLPVVVKTDNYLSPEGQYIKGRTRYIENREHLSAVLDELEVRGSWIAQECLPGYGVGAFLLVWGGRTRLAFAHRRIHEVPFWGGWSSLREGTEATGLVGTAEELLRAIEFAGAGMVEFRLSHGKARFLEINGRLWGSLALALHSNADFPKALVDCHTGGETEAAANPVRTGLRCRNLYPGEFGYVLSVLKGWGPIHGIKRPSKFMALAGLFTWSPRTKGDYLWRDDPYPGFAQAKAALQNIMTSIACQVRRVADKFRIRAQEMLFLAESNKRQPKLRKRSTVLFLCYGNICRSAFAEAYWKRKNAGAVLSAGFHPHAGRSTPPWIVRAASLWGVDLSEHRSRIVHESDVNDADAIFVMDRWNLEDLLSRYPESRHKTWFLSAVHGARGIPDPYLLGERQAFASFWSIKKAIDLHVTRIADGAESNASA